MSQSVIWRWTTADLERLPDNGNHYEIIAGDLFVSRAPHRRHQKVADKICAPLNQWSEKTGIGEATTATGIIFTEADNVIPDVVWISHEKLASAEDDQGHLITAPELVVEVLSPSNEVVDRQHKLKLYSAQGVQEYWIADRLRQQIEVYRRLGADLKLVTTLLASDTLSSPMLPNFTCSVQQLFS